MMDGSADRTRPSCLIVYGPLRGGTTLLRLMIDGHPRLSCIDETDFLVDHLHHDEDGWRYDRTELEADRIYRGSGVRIPEGLDGRDAFRDMVRQIASASDTLPVLMLHRRIEVASAMVPDAAILRFTRDPRDSARSAIGMGWAGDVWHGVVPWIETERDWQAFAATEPAHPILTLRFEDLVSAPEEGLRALCAFVGLPYDPAMLSYPDHTTYDAPDAKLADQWKRKLTPQQIALVEHRVGDLLPGSGYALSGAPPPAPSAWMQARLRLSNRTFVWRDLIRRYGIADPVLRGVGRRLNIPALRRGPERRMDEKTVKYLK